MAGNRQGQKQERELLATAYLCFSCCFPLKATNLFIPHKRNLFAKITTIPEAQRAQNRCVFLCRTNTEIGQLQNCSRVILFEKMSLSIGALLSFISFTSFPSLSSSNSECTSHEIMAPQGKKLGNYSKCRMGLQHSTVGACHSQ